MSDPPTAFAEVAVPLPLPPLTYAIPSTLAGQVAPGVRVRVPVGRRRLVGVVVAFAEAAPPGVNVRPLEGVLDCEPVLPPDLLDLARFTANYYLAPLGEVVRTMLPSDLPPWGDRRVWLTNAGALAPPRGRRGGGGDRGAARRRAAARRRSPGPPRLARAFRGPRPAGGRRPGGEEERRPRGARATSPPSSWRRATSRPSGSPAAGRRRGGRWSNTSPASAARPPRTRSPPPSAAPRPSCAGWSGAASSAASPRSSACRSTATC